MNIVVYYSLLLEFGICCIEFTVIWLVGRGESSRNTADREITAN